MLLHPMLTTIGFFTCSKCPIVIQYLVPLYNSWLYISAAKINSQRQRIVSLVPKICCFRQNCNISNLLPWSFLSMCEKSRGSGKSEVCHLRSLIVPLICTYVYYQYHLFLCIPKVKHIFKIIFKNKCTLKYSITDSISKSCQG